MSEALEFAALCILQPLTWFWDILSQINGQQVWLTALIIYLSYKFLLSPLFGRARSDLANESYSALKRSRRKEK